MAGGLAVWFVNAARRTLHTLAPASARPDDAWAEARLTEGERSLFTRLPAQERAHAILVARRLLRERPGATRELVAAALLHDVGKLGTPGTGGSVPGGRGASRRSPATPVVVALWRVLTHLLPPSSAPPEPRLEGLAGARQARVHHPLYGAELLRAAGAAPRVIELVARHHDPFPEPDLRLLQECDERT